MKNKFTIWILLMSLLASVCLPITSYAFDKESRTNLDNYFNAMEKNDPTMLSITMREDGKIIYQRQIGMADIKNNIKTDGNTKFRVGSITKTFTATMIMQLIEEGKLTLETPLSKFFPKVKNSDKITIQHLLQHKSGIFNYSSESKFFKYYTKEQSRQKMLKRIYRFDPVFAPGTKWMYSNSNYLLLGYIIEDITQSTYPEQVESRIIKKINLENTAYGGKTNSSNNEAYSYHSYNGQWHRSPEWHESSLHAAGAIISTTQDISEFMTALASEKLVSNDSFGSMVGKGLGLAQMLYYQKIGFGHSGYVDSTISQSFYLPKEKLSLVISSNRLNIPMQDILLAALDTYHDIPIDIPSFNSQPIKLSKSKLKKFRGTYQSDPFGGEKISIEMHDDILIALIADQPFGYVVPYGENEFRVNSASSTLRFVDPKTGKATKNSFIIESTRGKAYYKRQ